MHYNCLVEGNNRMIKNRVGQLLKNNGQSVADLQRGTGLSYDNAWQLANQNVSSIRFSTLAKLCEFFNCQPGDLLQYDPNHIPGVTSSEKSFR
jgi:putative transcriptional regulator